MLLGELTRVPLISEWEGGKQVGYKMGEEYPDIEEKVGAREVIMDGFDGRDGSGGYGGGVRNRGRFLKGGLFKAVGLT